MVWVCDVTKAQKSCFVFVKVLSSSRAPAESVYLPEKAWAAYLHLIIKYGPRVKSMRLKLTGWYFRGLSDPICPRSKSKAVTNVLTAVLLTHKEEWFQIQQADFLSLVSVKKPGKTINIVIFFF